MKISFILFAIMGFAYPAFSHDSDTSTQENSERERERE